MAEVIVKIDKEKRKLLKEKCDEILKRDGSSLEEFIDEKMLELVLTKGIGNYQKGNQ